MSRIVVTPRSLTSSEHPVLAQIQNAGYEVITCIAGKRPSEEELVSLLPGCVGYLAGVESITDKVLSTASDLRVISRNGVGTDNIDLKAAERRGITVCTTPGANAQGVAELTIGLILSLVRHIAASDAVLKSDGWSRQIGSELAGRQLGVVGCGSIGQRVATMAIGIGMNVVGYDLYPTEDFAPVGFSWESLADVLCSDVVTLHCPPTEEPILDTTTIASMRNGAWLINTARAALVDDDAVLSALDSGQLSGYATDVYHDEPPIDRSIAEHPRVIATPHIGGYTGASVDRAAHEAARNMLDVLGTAGESSHG